MDKDLASIQEARDLWQPPTPPGRPGAIASQGAGRPRLRGHGEAGWQASERLGRMAPGRDRLWCSPA